jgi:hypothetical protein
VVALAAPTGSLSGTVSLSATVQDPIRIAKVEFFVNGSTSLGVATTAPYTYPWDTTTDRRRQRDADGHGHRHRRQCRHVSPLGRA